MGPKNPKLEKAKREKAAKTEAEAKAKVRCVLLKPMGEYS